MQAYSLYEANYKLQEPTVLFFDHFSYDCQIVWNRRKVIVAPEVQYEIVQLLYIIPTAQVC